MADPTLPSTGTTTSGDAGTVTGTESSLSSWVGPYVTDMLGKGWALSEQPYQAYTGPLTAGPSAAQTSAFQGIAGLTIPTSDMGAFTPQSFTDAGVSQQYMSPYIQQALQPQLDEARRQSQISRLADAARLSKAGAYGGTRQALMEAEGARNLGTQLAGITGAGYQKAYEQAAQQFNTEQQRQQAAQELLNNYGLAALTKQAELGQQERGIEAEGIAADKAQFEEERAYPYKQVQYMQSLLQGLPLAAQSYQYSEPSMWSQVLGATGDVGSFLESSAGKAFTDYISDLFK